MILQKKTLPAHFFNDLIEKCPAKELFLSISIYCSNLKQLIDVVNITVHWHCVIIILKKHES